MHRSRRLGDVTSSVPGVVHRGDLDPVVTELAVWERGATLAAGSLIAVPGVVIDDSVLRTCAEAAGAAALVRAPTGEAAQDQLTQRCAELGLGLALLKPGEPWLPVLRDLESALGASPRPDDLFDLADEIAAAVGGPAILEDASFRVLAYSAFVGDMDRGRAEAILGRRIPDEWRDYLVRTGSLDRLRAGTEVVDLVDGPWRARRRLITAVRAGTRQLGIIWVAEGDRPLPADAPQALRRAADAAVPQLLRYVEVVEAEADRRARQMSTLLDGRAGAVTAATALGLSPAGAFAVLALRSCAEDLPDEERTARLLDHVTLCCQSFRRPAAVTRTGSDVLVVVELGAEDAGGRASTAAVRLLQDVVRLAGSGAASPVQGAASPVSSGVAALPRLRDQALAALAVLDPDGGPQSVDFEELETRVLLREIVGQMDSGTRLRSLDRLREQDSRTGTRLLETMRAYLDCCGSATRTATTLGIHVTTLRHRVRRIQQVSGLSLDDPEARIACELVLRLQET